MRHALSALAVSTQPKANQNHAVHESGRPERWPGPFQASIARSSAVTAATNAVAGRTAARVWRERVSIEVSNMSRMHDKAQMLPMRDR